MHVIYIDKKWLDTIGDIKDMILIRSEDGDYFSVLAMEKNMNLSYPFMEAQLIRQMKDGNDEYILPAKIPTAFISGIFDLTQEEYETRYGFVLPKKKKFSDVPTE